MGVVVRGLVAGAFGTAAMDALLFARYRRGGGDNSLEAWELSSDVSSWEQAPAPAQVGRRLVESVFDLELPPSRAALVNNVTHWAYGMISGASYLSRLLDFATRSPCGKRRIGRAEAHAV